MQDDSVNCQFTMFEDLGLGMALFSLFMLVVLLVMKVLPYSRTLATVVSLQNSCKVLPKWSLTVMYLASISQLMHRRIG